MAQSISGSSNSGGKGGTGAPLQAHKSPGRRTSVTPLSVSLAANAHAIRLQFHQSADLVLRMSASPAAPGRGLAVLYLQGIVDESVIRQDIVARLEGATCPEGGGPRDAGRQLLEKLRVEVMTTSLSQVVSTLETALDALLLGCCLLLVDGSAEAIAAEAAGGEMRPVGEAGGQTVLRGPRHSFNESLHTNIGLIRRILRSEKLTVETLRIGRQTCTETALLYVHGIAEEGLVGQARSRLDEIDIDGITDSAGIEGYIQDGRLSPFPTVMNTERPDEVCESLLQGGIAIVVDGSPFVLLAPVTFPRFFHSRGDDSGRFGIGGFLRIIRLAAFFLSLNLTGLYVAVTTFHQEVMPSDLLVSLSAQREGVPFPALAEALLLELTLEMLREAGVRMPRAIGPAAPSAAPSCWERRRCSAGLASPGMVVVVSFAALSGYAAPGLGTVRLLRFLLLISAGLLGFVGIIAIDLFILIHLASLQSFGVPYLSSPAAWTKEGGKPSRQRS